MTDWFEWNGTKCTAYGIHVEEHPAITLPAERATFTYIPGRSGSLTVLENEDVYDDMLLTCSCFIEDTSRLSEITDWLRGSGTVTFANRQGSFYYARIVNQIPFEQVLRSNPHRTFSVTFRCAPLFYLTPGNDITVTSTGTFIENSGMLASEPVLKVTLNADAEITIGGYLFELKDVTGTVAIDTPKLESYKNHACGTCCDAASHISTEYEKTGIEPVVVNLLYPLLILKELENQLTQSQKSVGRYHYRIYDFRFKKISITGQKIGLFFACDSCHVFFKFLRTSS